MSSGLMTILQKRQQDGDPFVLDITMVSGAVFTAVDFYNAENGIITIGPDATRYVVAANIETLRIVEM